MDSISIGIDLGSAASSMAWATEDGQIQVLCNAEGDPTTPSVIDFSQTPPLIGKQAWKRRFADAPEVVMFFRRWMGTDFVHCFTDQRWTAVDMAALILAKLRRDSEAALERPVTNAAIAIPAYLSMAPRRCFIQAATQAGLEVEALIEEPVAAAMAYVNRYGLTNGLYLVYQLSGATFEASLIRLDGDCVEVLEINGNNCLGTVDWINRIAAWVSTHEIRADAPVQKNEADTFERFMPIAELLDEAMRTRSEAHFSLDGITDHVFTRVKFEEMTEEFLCQTSNICEGLLQKRELTWDRLDGVMLAGEAVRIPTVIDFVRRFFGRNPLPVVEEAIAVGAALYTATRHDNSTVVVSSGSNRPSLRLPAEGTPLQIVDILTVNRRSLPARIEFCVGDLTTLQAKDAVDVLVVSAFPNSYPPLPGSLIGALARKGVSVEDLAKRKEVDLRQSFSCWMSPKLVDVPTNIHFGRILCFEPYVRGTPAKLVGDIFRSLSPFVGEIPPIKTVASPIPSTGYQGVDPEKMLRLLVQAAVHWMALGMPLSCFKIACMPGPHVEALQRVFREVKLASSTASLPFTHPFKYDVFLSYAHAELNEAAILQRKLTEAMPELRLFFDRKDLDPGAAWQQEIYESLDDCRKVVALLTPAYLGSKVCLEEFNIAVCRDRGTSRRILSPIYLYSASLPTYMKLVQFLDCRECNSVKLDSACDILAKELAVEECQ
jgi:hypothetical protein